MKTPATCHPDRPNHSKGLCNSCYRAKCYRYNASVRATKRLAAKRSVKDGQLRVNYGLGLAEYEQMLETQEGKCAICRRPPTKRQLSVDHEKETGNIRGLLCGQCNSGIGMLRHDPKLLQAAIAYLADPPFKNDISGVVIGRLPKAPKTGSAMKIYQLNQESLGSRV